jgi:Ca2+-binding RTX toxin-like protein
LRVLRLAAVAVLTGALLPMSTPATAKAATCQGKRATIVGTSGADRIRGTDRADVIAALGGDDVINSLGGDDLVCGNGGADQLVGGPGNDRLYGGGDRLGDDVGGTFLVGDILRGGRGDDVLVGGWDDRKAQSRRRPDTFSWSDATGRVTINLSGSTGTGRGYGADRIRIQPRMGVAGSPYGDTITGSDNPDLIHGMDGDDRIGGGEGADRIFAETVGGRGDDTVLGGAGSDFIGSYSGRDDLRGGADNDFIEAYGQQPVSVQGDRGRDQVAQAISRSSGIATSGGPDRDVVSLYGDHLEGHSPRARFTVDLRDGSTTAQLPSSSPTGTVGGYEEYRFIGVLRWNFEGSPDADRVWAITGGELRAFTFGGDDWVSGTALADTINAGDGLDTVAGNAGRDVCQNAERGTC